MKLFRKIQEAIDPMIGKTVMKVITHGCMATINEFDFIGTIVGISYPIRDSSSKFYKVEVLKSKSGEKRDKNLDREYEEVPSWYCQKLSDKLYIVYD